MASEENVGLVDPSHRELSALGLSTAALFMVVFGFIWMGWGFSKSSAFTDFSSNRMFPAARWICFYMLFVAFLAISFGKVMRARRRIKVLVINPDKFHARFSSAFRVICLFESVGCVLVVALALGFHRIDLLAPGISLMVGVHFVPLARLFRINAYLITGAAIIFLDIVSIFVSKGQNATLMSASATGIVLWGTAMYLLILARLGGSARIE